MLSVQVRFIRLVAWIGRHSVLLGRERMYHACFKSGTGESVLGSEMVIAGTLDNDDDVLNVVLLLSMANLRDGCPEVTGLMLESLWLDE
jgi:hypothetical protein